MNLTSSEQQVKKLHEIGVSIRGIASELNIDKSKVQRILKRLSEASCDTDDTLIDTPSSIADTAGDTPVDTLSDTTDTGSERPFDTANTPFDTENVVDDTPFDTLSQSRKQAVSAINSKKETLVSLKRSYNLTEVKNLMAQVFLYKQEYNEFVNYVISIHSGNPLSFVKQNDYHGITRKAKRLLQSAKHLAIQLEEDYNDLLVARVLLTIQEVVNKVITGKDPVNISYGSYNLGDKVRALQIWVDSTESDFLQPAFYDHE